MNRKPTRTDDRTIFEQAAQWHLLMQKSPGPAERAAFDDWLLESRRHVRNYLLVTALDRELTQIDPRRSIDASAPSDKATGVVRLQGMEPAVARPTLDVKRPNPHRWHWALAGAAACAAIAVAAFLWRWDSGGNYITAVGEQRIAKLPDGSVMYLNTHSRAEVEYSATAREIHLLRGEALFVVAKEAQRPFRVAAGKTVIQAVGTEFNVYRRDEETAVAVLEGRVQVFASENERAAVPAAAVAQLSAGEEISVKSDGRIAKLDTADVGNAVAWRDRRLVFREQALTDIVREFNRYNPAPKFRVEGANVEARRYSGIFDAYDPESLAQVLSADSQLTLVRAGHDIVIRRRVGGESVRP